MDTVLKKQTTSIFRKHPEDANSKFLWNTAIHITCYPNLDHIMFIRFCENAKKKSNDWSKLEKLNYKYHIAFNVTAICTNSVLQFILPFQMQQESKMI
jgi:hypothetical protein